MSDLIVEDVTPRITVHKSTVEADGGCSGCHTRDTTLIRVVRINQILFRLCPRCTHKLKVAL